MVFKNVAPGKKIMKRNLTGLKIRDVILTLVIFWFVLMLCVSCRKENLNPPIENEKVRDYLPLSHGNQWTYTKEGVDMDGQILSSSTEKWKVNSNLFIDLYKVTPSGEDYLGYKAMYLIDNLEISDIIGTFLSLKYLNLPTDSLVFVASDSMNMPRDSAYLLRERWIKGGLIKLESSFGELECICSKTSYTFPHKEEQEYFYFCKNVGIVLMEKNYIDKDSTGNSYIGFSWRRTLSDYQIN